MNGFAVTPPCRFQLFLTTNTWVASVPQPQPAASAQEAAAVEPAASTCAAAGTLPVGEGERDSVEALVRSTRRLCALASATRAQLVGLARALHALERLPHRSEGVAAEYSVGIHLGGKPGDEDEWWATFLVSGTTFEVGRLLVTWGDHKSSEVFEAEVGGHCSLGPEDEDGWLEVLTWINEVENMFRNNSPEELKLFVSDDSTPDCLANRNPP